MKLIMFAAMLLAYLVAALLLASIAPASAKVWIMQWGPNSFDVRETRGRDGMWDYPIAVDVKTLAEARRIAKQAKGK
jgi:hypothetical protein